MKLRITHETRYDYASPVQLAHHMSCLHPVDTPRQRVLAHALHIDPQPACCHEAADLYGNLRCRFSLQAPHRALTVTASSLVCTQTPPPDGTHTIAWEAVRERLRYHAGARYEPAAEFRFASALIRPDATLADYAAPSFAPGTPLLAAARDLMHRIHAEFRYEPQSTAVDTPVLQALAWRRGVCQDFAQVFIGSLRSLGLAARYVSGYLLTQPPPGQPRLRGADASHAWAQVWLPGPADTEAGGGWYDLAPTNDRAGWGTPGEDYVRLAIGRDYAEVSPLRGVIHGGDRHTLAVAVTVEPVEGEAS